MKNILILLLTLSGFAVQAQDAPKMNTLSITDFKGKEKKAAPTFEGVVTITDTKEVGFAGEYQVKGYQVASTITIKEGEKRKKIINNEDQTVIALKKVKGEKLAIKTLKTDAGKSAGEIKLSVTKETKKIGDYNCSKVVANDSYTKIEAWVATDLKIYFGDLLAAENGLEMLNEITSKEGVEGTILEMTRTDMAKGTSSTMTVSVEAKKVKDKAFKIPKGYKLVDQTRKPSRARSMPSATSFSGVTNRAYEIQKKVREGKMEAPADGSAPAAAPAKEAAPAPKKEK